MSAITELVLAIVHLPFGEKFDRSKQTLHKPFLSPVETLPYFHEFCAIRPA